MDSTIPDRELDFCDRLARTVRLWREATDRPLPRLPSGSPSEQLATLELTLMEVLVARADPRSAADVQFQLAELVEGRPSEDALRRRVEAVLPSLRRLDEARSGSNQPRALGPLSR